MISLVSQICLVLLPYSTMSGNDIPEIMNLRKPDLNKKAMALRQKFCLSSTHITHNMNDTVNDALVFL